MVLSKKKIYEGKAKVIFAIDGDPSMLIQHFKDDITAFDNLKTAKIPGKGIFNNYISEFLMRKITEIGISNHFVKVLNMREQLIKKLDIIPLEVVVRNVVAGSLCKRFGLVEGERLNLPLVEFYHKNDNLKDPLVSEEHIMQFDWVKPWEIEELKSVSLRINDFLCGVFSTVGITLVDFKLEYGYMQDKIILGDEISPDVCRLWDAETKEKMDKDRFRLDLGDVAKFYKEIAKRLGVLKNILREKELVKDEEMNENIYVHEKPQE